jgi:hypothetical protein
MRPRHLISTETCWRRVSLYIAHYNLSRWHGADPVLARARIAAFRYGGSVRQALQSWTKSGLVGAGSPKRLVKARSGRSWHLP